MTVQQLIDSLDAAVLSGGDTARTVDGCYICDLLSLAMSKVKENDIWITVQTNINIVAIGVLTELSCVLIAENMNVEEAVLKKAQEENVTILRSSKNAYQLASEIAGLL